MTGDDTSTDEDSQGVASGHSSDSQSPTETRHSSTAGWRAWLDALRTRLQEQIAVWPEKVAATIDLVDGSSSSAVPDDDDILIYVHGYLGEGRLTGVNISGAHQAGALRQALADEFEGVDTSSPTVVTATWNSSTTWPRATNRAVTAGENLAQWVKTNADDYARLTIVGHSLGGRVVLTALTHTEEVLVESAGLLGAAVSPKAVCTEYRNGIESAVDEGVFNYHSQNDAMVCQLYSFREGSDGIGCTGTVTDTEERVPANYVDVDVSETVHRHLDYFKPLPETADGNCIPELAERQLVTGSVPENE